MKLPNYLSKIERLVKKGKLTKGALTHVDIAHDDWCALLTHGGPCDCNPEIRLRPHKQPLPRR